MATFNIRKAKTYYCKTHVYSWIITPNSHYNPWFIHICVSTLKLYFHSIQMSYLPYFIFFFLLPLASSKPDCPTRCGKMPIPYPFGVGSDCSLEKSFTITCIASKPYLNISNKSVEVVEISLDNPARIRIKYPHLLYGACYNISTGNSTWNDGNDIDLSESQYSLSEDNWLTGIGCDDFVASSSYDGNQSLRDACAGYCSDGYTLQDLGNCPNNGERNSVGEGCCRTPIPKGKLHTFSFPAYLRHLITKVNFICFITKVNFILYPFDSPGCVSMRVLCLPNQEKNYNN